MPAADAQSHAALRGRRRALEFELRYVTLADMDLLINIDVPNLPEAVAFYTAAFGLVVGSRGGVAGRWDRHDDTPATVIVWSGAFDVAFREQTISLGVRQFAGRRRTSGDVVHRRRGVPLQVGARRLLRPFAPAFRARPTRLPARFARGPIAHPTHVLLTDRGRSPVFAAFPERSPGLRDASELAPTSREAFVTFVSHRRSKSRFGSRLLQDRPRRVGGKL